MLYTHIHTRRLYTRTSLLRGGCKVARWLTMNVNESSNLLECIPNLKISVAKNGQQSQCYVHISYNVCVYTHIIYVYLYYILCIRISSYLRLLVIFGQFCMENVVVKICCNNFRLNVADKVSHILVDCSKKSTEYIK